MAKQRQISDRFWFDTYVAEELTEPDEKLLFIYLLTNQYVLITGIYEISIRTINFDTNIPAPRIREILQKLSDANKIHYLDGYVVLANYYKHTSYNAPNVKRYVIEQIKSLPAPIKDRFAETIKQIQAIALPTTNNSKQPQNTFKPTSCQEDGNKQAKNETNSSQPLANPLARPSQPLPPLSNPNPNPIANANTNTNPSPLTPQGERLARNSDGSRELGGFVQRPDGKVERKEVNQSQEKGWREGASKYGIGIWLTDEEFKKLKSEFGPAAAIDIPDQVGEWASEKGITVKDPYKMCRQFAMKAQKEAVNG